MYFNVTFLYIQVTCFPCTHSPTCAPTIHVPPSLFPSISVPSNPSITCVLMILVPLSLFPSFSVTSNPSTTLKLLF